ncbi:MAG: hypothetical protein Q9227_002863 [Pyrenula ochraceoflavens]
MAPSKAAEPEKQRSTDPRLNSKTLPRSNTSRSTAQKPEMMRTPSVQTRYMQMLLHIDEIPRMHNILAAFFTWVLLAGFITFPGTFTSAQNALNKKHPNGEAEEVAHHVLNKVVNVGLIWVAGVCCVVGGGGMLWLWFRWRSNYIFLINRIFLPGLMNSLAGFLSTIINVYTAQHGDWSISAKATGITTGACAGVTLLLFALYNFWVLKRVKRKHAREMDVENGQTNGGHEHETVGDKLKHAAHAKPLEPGSVI